MNLLQSERLLTRHGSVIARHTSLHLKSCCGWCLTRASLPDPGLSCLGALQEVETKQKLEDEEQRKAEQRFLELQRKAEEQRQRQDTGSSLFAQLASLSLPGKTEVECVDVDAGNSRRQSARRRTRTRRLARKHREPSCLSN